VQKVPFLKGDEWYFGLVIFKTGFNRYAHQSGIESYGISWNSASSKKVSETGKA
jgi:hypothetical protein